MSKTKTINFYPEKEMFEGWFDEPVPAKKLVPQWYKNQGKYTDNFKVISPETGLFNETIKACMPVFDVLTAGYIITTPADIYVGRHDDGSPSFSWGINDYTCIESHAQSQYDKYNIPPEYYPIGYKFINSWITKTPKGYSSIFMTPALRDDLPFSCIPAVVDTDKHPIAINFPFFLRKDFQGLIPKGTPMIQIIPFKREKWEHKTNKFNLDNWKAWKRAEGTIQNRYKTFFRTLKEWS